MSGVLCCLQCYTGGLQGPNLGSDETETVLLIYGLVSIKTNEIVGVREYVVRPLSTDQNDNLLSEQVLQETNITAQTIKTVGIPLDKALHQFEVDCRRLEVDPGSVTLVTDGQLPLRQVLHPEAARNALTLPHQYTRFSDVRKDVARFYGSQQPFSSIPEALLFLDIPHSGETDFYGKEFRDMINIIQRLISDGYKFNAVETINLVLEPGICSKDEEVDSNCVVRARGLPWQSSDQDIAKFFIGLNVAKGGVALCLSPMGRRNGEALVRFTSSEHRDMALRRHKHHIGSRYIEVYRASGEDFVSVAGGSNNEAQAFLTRGAQVIIRMRGLPYDCTALQVMEFFSCGEDGCSVMDADEGVLFVRKPDGRSTGDAFVLFKEESDAPKALARHRELIGTRYIELFRSTTAEVQQVLNRTMETFEPPPPLLPQVPLLPQHIITSGTRKDCIRLRGLPYEAQVEHILEFLGDHAKSIVFQGVHMVYNSQGQPSGEAFIQMESEASAFAAAQLRHHRYMTFGKKQRYIEVFQCSGEDMSLVLSGGQLSPSLGGGKSGAGGLLSPGTPPPQVAAQQVLLPPPAPLYLPVHPHHPVHHPVHQEFLLDPTKMLLFLPQAPAPPPLGLKRTWGQAFAFPHPHPHPHLHLPPLKRAVPPPPQLHFPPPPPTFFPAL